MGWSNRLCGKGLDPKVWIENERQYKEQYSLYLLEASNGFIKIGISQHVYNRCRYLNKDLRQLRLPYTFAIKDEIFIGDKQHAFGYEQALLTKFSEYRVYKRPIYSGASEVLEIPHLTPVYSAYNIVRGLLKK